jgi:hypothetical protein
MSGSCLVFLVGEGPSDIGDLAHEPNYRQQQEGFFQPLLRKIVQPGLSLIFEGRKITTLRKRQFHSRREGQRQKAAQALALAWEYEASILVFAKDVDRTAGKRASTREMKSRIELMSKEIIEGFDEAKKKIPECRSVRTFGATPCRMIEAWALGDPSALKIITKHPVNAFPNKPEELWGKESDPQSNHPKRVLERILGHKATSKDFEAIAGNASPVEIEKTCPLSFKPFYNAFQSADQSGNGRNA